MGELGVSGKADLTDLVASLYRLSWFDGDGIVFQMAGECLPSVAVVYQNGIAAILVRGADLGEVFF